jgi:hypothetical protein
VSEGNQGGALPLPPKPAGYPKWAIFGCIGCVVAVVLILILVFGGCLVTGALVDKTINDAQTQELAKETRTFLYAIERGDLAAARKHLAPDLAAELTGEKFQELVAKDPDAYKVADTSFEPVVIRGPMIAMQPATLDGTLRTKSGATRHCRFVYSRELVSESGPEPAPEPPEHGAAPPNERMSLKWRIRSFKIQADPIPDRED